MAITISLIFCSKNEWKIGRKNWHILYYSVYSSGHWIVHILLGERELSCRYNFLNVNNKDVLVHVSLVFFSLSLAIWCLVCFIPTLIIFHIHYLNYRDRLHLYYNKLRLTFVSVVALCLLVGFLVGK